MGKYIIRMNKLVFFSVLIASGFLRITQLHAAGTVSFGPDETKITGSIKYSVIGKYNAQFDSFKGRITVNERTNQIESVDLEIDADSIKSNCAWCDKIVRSKQLLSTKEYPKITFESNQILKEMSGYTVKGILDLHGIKRVISFPFQAQVLTSENSITKILDIKGQLQINRKDFKITWNKILDQGGVLVGNFILVEWGIKADIKY